MKRDAMNEPGPDHIPHPTVPSRDTIKAMVRRGCWDELGELFGFEPKFSLIGGKKYFNWVSAPASLTRALGMNAKEKLVAVKFTDGPDASSPETKQWLECRKPTRREVLLKHKQLLFASQKGHCFYCGLSTT